MGKIGKPQKRKKNKIKSFGIPKNIGKLNRAPKSLEQEVPRRLLELGIAIKETQSGKSYKNKFKNNSPDGPSPNSSGTPVIKGKKFELKQPIESEDGSGKRKMGKKMQKLTLQATEEYINDLKAPRPFLENFEFKKRPKESKTDFLDRVCRESHIAVAESKIADRNQRSPAFEIKLKAKEKLRAEKKEKRKEKQKEPETPKPVPEESNTDKEEQKEIKDFFSLPDDFVSFGEVVHAPPTLTVLPKKAIAQGRDRPGARMPELKEAFSTKNNKPKDKVLMQQRKKGKTVKRKHLSLQQQMESDAKREEFVELYRQMKKEAKTK